jgi:hypothetical protein
MNKVEAIAQEIARLSPAEFAALRDLVFRHDNEAWDHQFAEDVEKGRLEQLADKALRDHAAGRSTEL